MAQHFGVKEYVGIDHSAASLRVADALAKELDMKNVTLREGDLFKLPYDDGYFDIVISQGVLHHTSDPYRGFRELVRICRPGWLREHFSLQQVESLATQHPEKQDQ